MVGVEPWMHAQPRLCGRLAGDHCCHAMHARVADSELMMDGRVLCRFVGRDLIEWLGSTEPYHRRMHNHRVMHRH
jgi:hypothetical protein